ncbi:MerR family transcriptional regulator [Pontibacter sp. SGAir0037]|uniref:MerR family transcriptional regulator n=1 Tax=Pontibacter sp. SGAir0037 TaxID=2571030 RepID=UPI0010CD40A8|nr:MerR family transcriptional regulator [Pontibacter sp. SGAir0037]QCR22918.1 helix-turn-helix-type transcriptional regulator [Pontibacter sp. SGAir0037]
MGHYSIKELEHLSGIKAHTIRIWEQRYSILSPKRTDTNIRYYDDQDLKTILNVSFLNAKGIKISKIAQMESKQISQKVQELSEDSGQFSGHINLLISAMVDMDEEVFDKTISTATLQLGLRDTFLHVIYPFLNKIGVLWQTGNISPAHEHFVSNLVRQKIIVAIDGQVVRRQQGNPTYLLFLPEGELHELALLFMNYVIRSHHFQVIYLGQHLPFKDLEITYEHCRPAYMCTVLTSTPDRDQVQAYLDKLSNRFPEATIYICGAQVQYDFLVFPRNIHLLRSVQEFLALF